MTRDEAQKALDEGKRVRHPGFGIGAYAVIVDFDIAELVCVVSRFHDPIIPKRSGDLFENYDWPDGWELYEPEAQKPAPTCEVRCERCANENNLFTCLHKFNPPKDGLDQWCEFFWPADPSEWRCETCRRSELDAPRYFAEMEKNPEKCWCLCGPQARSKYLTDRCGEWKCRIPERG